MFRGSAFLKKSFSQRIALAVVFLAVFTAGSALAETAYSPYALQKALSSDDSFSLYAPKSSKGFNLSSSTFSGLASGAASSGNVAELNSNQRLYALLVDGRYDFNHEPSLLSSPLHPYLSGGMGMATAGSLTSGGGSNAANAAAVPMFRLGGGVAYRLGKQWDLSLEYKEGHSAPNAGDDLFTGRGQQPVDLHTLNLGMSYSF